MLEVVNTQKSPIQVMIRSRKAPMAFATLVIPGIGKGKNVFYLEDERMTDQLKSVENDGLIKINRVADRQKKGEQ